MAILTRWERRSDPLATRWVFLGRILRCFAGTLLVVAFSLALGAWGYHRFGDVPWIDALHNAALILTGMGPVVDMTTTAGKLFSVFYALYSGLAFLTLVAIIVTPLYHRLLHHFHLEMEGQELDRP